MRTKLFIWGLAFITFSTFGQYTAIPDANFEDALQSLGLDSGANDGRVLTANISSVTSLDINSKNISDLTGIEAFASLEVLFFYTNNISSVDLSSNTSLKQLSCGGNNLSSLNLTNNVDLEIFSCINNQITTIDFSTNTKLETIAVSQNLLTELDVSNNLALKILWVDTNEIVSLDVSKNIALEELAAHTNQFVHVDMRNGENTNLQSLSLSVNPNLSCVLVDDATFSNTNWAVVSGVINTSVTRFVNSEADCEESYTYVPDDNFEQALIDLGYDNVLNDYVITANINAITSLNVANKNINDLTGIADFTALTNLSCFNNSMESLILSDNTNLITISCFNNNLENIDISGCSNLEGLYCQDNNLESLDFSGNNNLENLFCHNNSLTVLDISNINITQMLLNNVFNNTAFQAFGNENLSCIIVGESFIEDSRNNWSNDVDNSSRFVISLEACENATYVPDDNFEQALIDLNLDDYLDDYVITANISGVTSLNVPSKEIYDLTGIEDFTALTFLGANDNNLTMVDLSENLNLDNLSIQNNNLEALDLSKNVKIFRVNCDSNKIMTLDLNLNTALRDLSCSTNELIALNVKNGNNTNVTFFVTQLNPNLTCIEVDDESSGIIGTGSFFIDSHTSLSENCNSTASIVDTEFNNAISVYPNPVKDKLHVSIADNQTIKKIQVYNLLGSKVIEQKSETIDFANIPSGMYLLKIESTEGKIATQKIIKN